VKKRNLLSCLAAGMLLVPHASLRAGEAATPPDTSGTVPGPAEDFSTPQAPLTVNYELDSDASYVGAARTNFGNSIKGNVTEQQASARFVLGVQKDADSPIFRLGLAYERYNFGLSKAAPLPDALQAENLVVGMDFNAFTSWLVRIEADPGFYNDARSDRFRNFNVPFTLGGSYIASEEVQWIVGLGIDFNRQFPVIPAIGVRWVLSDSWVIDAVLPTPRLEYDYSKALTLYLGGDVDDGTYRMDSGLGRALGNKRLSGSVVEYDEIRVGAGLSWKATKAFTFEVEGGYLPYREFDFHRADVHFSNDDGAAYGRISLNGQF
jgi:hypothetical protein